MFYKGDNFYDFLFAFDVKPQSPSEKCLFQKETICSYAKQILSF